MRQFFLICQQRLRRLKGRVKMALLEEGLDRGRVGRALLISFLLLFNLFLPWSSRPAVPTLEPFLFVPSPPFSFFAKAAALPVPFPVKTGKEPVLSLGAAASLVFDPVSAYVLEEKEADRPHAPASLTKLGSALLVRRDLSLTDVVTVGKGALSYEGNRMGLFEGERLSVESLLGGLLVFSASDATISLAVQKHDSVLQFVSSMNELVSSLGLKSTQFQNPIGLDAENQFTTARDIAFLFRTVLADEILKKFLSAKSITLSNLEKTRWHTLRNTNELLGKAGVVAGKTGTSEQAGGNLVLLVERDSRQIIVVLLGSEDRFGEAKRLADYVFRNWAW